MVATFLVGTIIYFWLYFPVPLIEDVSRAMWLSFYLLRPEEMFKSWVDSPNGEVALFDRLTVLSAAAILMLAAYGSGSLLLRCSRIAHELTPIERFVLSIGMGSNCLSLLALAIGLLGWLHPVVVAVLLALILCAAFTLWRWRAVQPVPVESNPTGVGAQPDRLDWITVSMGIPFALIILLGACLPPIDFDVREYHLQVPKEWYLNGRIDFLPHNVYGNMPLGAELPSVLAMAIIPGTESWWWGALAGKLVIGCFSWLGALLLYAAGSRFGSPAVGGIAAVVYISTPWIGKVSMNGLAEGVWGFYFFASFYVLLIGYQRLKPLTSGGLASRHAASSLADTQSVRAGIWEQPVRGFLAVAGFLAGAAVSCKYPAVVLVVCPLVVVLFCAGGRTRPLSNRVGSVAIYLLAAAVACGPWFAKNGWLAGNPTYPLLVDVFGGRTRTAAKDEQWKRGHQPPGYSGADVTAAAQKILWQSKFLSPALIPLAVCSLLRRKQRHLIAVQCGLLLYFVAVWWLWTHRIDRFLVPALPFLAWLAGMGACWSRTIAWRAVVFGFLVLALAVNFVFFGTNVLADNRYFVPLHELRDDEWTHVAPHRYFNSTQFHGTRVLLVGDAQPFDLRVPVLYNTCFDDCIFEQLMQGHSTSERLAALHDAQISHVYVDWSEIARYRQTYGYSEYVRPEVFQELVQTGVLEADDQFELFDSTATGRKAVFHVCDD